VIEPVIFIAVGVLLYLGSGWLGRLYSDSADRWERDGVIRYGGGLPGNKVWREESPAKFASRIEGVRFAALVSRWFLKICGLIFATGGLIQLIGLLLK
jgi:hypothetical protein